ncbi:unnamed protein product [Caenorhabditis nigoni]
MIPTTNIANENHESDSSSQFPRQNTFYIEEPNTKTKLWYHWFNLRIRQIPGYEPGFRIVYDQSNLVLLDRPQPPADRAWCTNDENPVLTIKLAKYIKPISVSYQHSKWNGTIPNGAPKTYDVVACLDCDDEEWEPLALNCQYSQYETNGKEQMCNISSLFDLPLIRKVQFRFRENYGDSKMTCINLVRVYGEANAPVKFEEKNSNSEQTCTDLRWYYHNNHFRYTWVS